ncbi:winged helix-turn-helix domain-containing protein [Candidatus Soleaferrea massiliensis]|uniref:winged helix-turn-helix domain-containing protein n=1 Tax=Candidatus Soleaferrea massiliensis TaxID=1470354 RepID=UPI00058DCF7C|nr:winged helix-turn-helix domain-containing protein [Candidatus Soleaferrea massiliensis]
MSKIIILKLDDPDGFLYNYILSLLLSRDATIETVTAEGAKISVAPGLTVYPAQRRVYSKVSEIILTRKEYDMLLYLLQNANQVFSFTQIYKCIWKESNYATG